MVRGPYPQELRRRAVRALFSTRDQYPSEWQAILANSERFGIRSAETLRAWVRRAEADGEHDAAPPTAARGTAQDHTEPSAASTGPQSFDIDRLTRDNAELRRTIGTLVAAVALLASELTRQLSRE
ncbi:MULTISPECIES: hypothetical protein [unclassified Micromonospora]|uniref:hypothetical protein n=1 Tax=unclassified Micromonospora TaxID=2617518 RepID=UPI001C24ECC1|nr:MULTISPECIES: hypothetical protein [unclassified Micromonospora]MBU8857796.1 hypothetical protein [Micromonospora sp. WMMB482]MDM4783427.1 hypothetical protein [Micromonospora sp. b486]